MKCKSPRFDGGFLCEGGRREKGEGRREKGNTRGAAMIELSETFSKRVILV
jgi:hypothetical protein